MIRIHKPSIVPNGEKTVRLQARIDIQDTQEFAFMICDKKYSEYLVTEVADAFVWAAARYAMIHHMDIRSDAPLSSDFLHNINYHFQVLSSADKKVTIPRIECETIDFKTSGTACLAPISCGVDSLYTVKKYTEYHNDKYKLTHLFLTTQGLFGQYKEPLASRNAVFSRGETVAKELDLDFIGTFTNPAVFPQDFGLAHPHSTLFSILSLRKLISKFFYPSGFSIRDFTIHNNSRIDAAYYDLILTKTLSLSGFEVISSGGEVTRLDKVRYISDYPLAQEKLSVCIRDSAINDNVCMKCKRTMLELDAIGSLEKFSKVFDIEFYRKNIKYYKRYLIENQDDPYMKELIGYYSIIDPDGIEEARKLSRPKKGEIRKENRKVVKNKALT